MYMYHTVFQHIDHLSAVGLLLFEKRNVTKWIVFHKSFFRTHTAYDTDSPSMETDTEHTLLTQNTPAICTAICYTTPQTRLLHGKTVQGVLSTQHNTTQGAQLLRVAHGPEVKTTVT